MNDTQQRNLFNILRKFFSADEGFNALKRNFDWAWQLTFEEKSGKVILTIEDHDHGGPIMTIGEVALLLKMDRAAVRRLTEERSQRRAKFPFPVLPINGRNLRFSRAAVEEWIKKIDEDSRNGSKAILRKSKRQSGGRHA